MARILISRNYQVLRYDLRGHGRTGPSPVLVLNGEHESKNVLRHTEEILRRVRNAEADTVPEAGDTSNMENSRAFNALVERFLDRPC